MSNCPNCGKKIAMSKAFCSRICKEEYFQFIAIEVPKPFMKRLFVFFEPEQREDEIENFSNRHGWRLDLLKKKIDELAVEYGYISDDIDSKSNENNQDEQVDNEENSKNLQVQPTTFRLFISSTFSDFNQERRLLQTYVFPEIKEYCVSLNKGYTFQPIDLRWGVSNEAQLDQKTLELCLNEVKSSKAQPHPNFLIMAGDRYGWVPTPYAIEQSEFEEILQYVKSNNKDIEIEYWSYKDKDGHTIQSANRNTNALELLEQWYKLDKNQLPASYILEERTTQDKNGFNDYTPYENWGPEENALRDILQEAVTTLNFSEEQQEKYFTSATEHEVMDGIFKYLKPTPYQSKLLEEHKSYEELDHSHVYGYIRNINSIEDENFNANFLDKDSSKVEEFKQGLKAAIKDENLLNVEANLTNLSKDENNGSLNYSYEALENEKDSLFVQTMIEYLKRSINEFSSEYKVSQKELIDSQTHFKDAKLKNFVARENALEKIDFYVDIYGNTPLVIYGHSGLGKSALMAKAIQSAIEKKKKVIYRFIGTHPKLNKTYDLLMSILNELNIPEDALEFDREDERNFLTNFNYAVRDKFTEIEEEVVIFIDAVDQLYNKDVFEWLPYELPNNLKIVISALEDESYPEDSKYFEALKEKTENLYKLEPFVNAKVLIKNILNKYGRTITESQFNYVEKLFNNIQSPLYLTIAAEELRHWHSYDTTADCEIDGKMLANSQKEMIHDFITNLNKVYHHDSLLLSKVFGYLYFTDGLSEVELLEIISTETEFIEYIAPETFHNNITKELPLVVWSRLHTQLKPFLKEESLDGQNVINLYHREFYASVSKKSDIQEQHEYLIDILEKVISKHENISTSRYVSIYIMTIIKYYDMYNNFTLFKKCIDFIMQYTQSLDDKESLDNLLDTDIDSGKFGAIILMSFLTNFESYSEFALAAMLSTCDIDGIKNTSHDDAVKYLMQRGSEIVDNMDENDPRSDDYFEGLMALSINENTSHSRENNNNLSELYGIKVLNGGDHKEKQLMMNYPIMMMTTNIENVNLDALKSSHGTEKNLGQIVLMLLENMTSTSYTIEDIALISMEESELKEFLGEMYDPNEVLIVIPNEEFFMSLNSLIDNNCSFENTDLLNDMQQYEENTNLSFNKFHNIEVLNLENPTEQDRIFASKGVIFTSSLNNIEVEKLQLEENGSQGFDEIILEILTNYFGNKYKLDDIVIALSSEEGLETMLQDNYQTDRVYFTIPDENFFMPFNT